MIEVHLHHPRGDFCLDVDISVPAQGITGLIGRSGSGKSTLFSCLAGHIRPTAGCISLRGRSLYNSELGINVPPAQRGVGLVFQDGLLFPHMTVARNLAYGARNVGTDFWEEKEKLRDIVQSLRR